MFMDWEKAVRPLDVMGPTANVLWFTEFGAIHEIPRAQLAVLVHTRFIVVVGAVRVFILFSDHFGDVILRHFEVTVACEMIVLLNVVGQLSINNFVGEARVGLFRCSRPS